MRWNRAANIAFHFLAAGGVQSNSNFSFSKTGKAEKGLRILGNGQSQSATSGLRAAVELGLAVGHGPDAHIALRPDRGPDVPHPGNSRRRPGLRSLPLARGSKVFAIKSSDGLAALNICICAKCGSTSFFYVLHKMLTGEEFPTKEAGPPWVQQWAHWKLPPGRMTSNTLSLPRSTVGM